VATVGAGTGVGVRITGIVVEEAGTISVTMTVVRDDCVVVGPEGWIVDSSGDGVAEVRLTIALVGLRVGREVTGFDCDGGGRITVVGCCCGGSCAPGQRSSRRLPRRAWARSVSMGSKTPPQLVWMLASI
jgi:hypothetical protein